MVDPSALPLASGPQAPGSLTPGRPAFDEGTAPSVGVYLHIPFCERICPYCDFAVVAAPQLAPEAAERYVEALLAELALRRAAFEGRRLASVYFGGGTPSLLTPEAIAGLVRAVRGAFASAPSDEPVEITLEVNPSTVERERLPGFRAAGVERVSLGVQSFDDGVLKRLGRAHRADEARRSLHACRDAGFKALCLDLIFAAPGQGIAVFERDLAEALQFSPEHVSCYELTIEPRTPFATAAQRGQLTLPDEDLAAAMHETAERALTGAGLARYELSNYARPGFEAVHNRRYWQRRPVLGLGVGAFSTDPTAPQHPFGVRRSNPRALAVYLERVESGVSPEEEPELLGAATARGEAVFLALRCSRGLEAARFADEFGAAPRAFFGPAIDALVGGGLLEEASDGDLRLSARGRLLADSVFESFVGPSD